MESPVYLVLAAPMLLADTLAGPNPGRDAKMHQLTMTAYGPGSGPGLASDQSGRTVKTPQTIPQAQVDAARAQIKEMNATYKQRKTIATVGVVGGVTLVGAALAGPVGAGVGLVWSWLLPMALGRMAFSK